MAEEEKMECSHAISMDELLDDFDMQEELAKVSSNSEITECSTGILIDFDEVILDKEFSKISLNAEKPGTSSSHCLNLNKRRDTKLLGADLDNLGNMPSTPRGGWKTPSPKSMRKITKEATRIVDEMLDDEKVIDEQFPSPFSQVGSFSESSPELEDTPNANSNKDTESKPKVASPPALMLHYKHESIPKIARPVIKMLSSNLPIENSEEFGDLEFTAPFFRAMTTFNDNLPNKEEWSIQYKSSKSPGCQKSDTVCEEIDNIEYLVHPFGPTRLNIKPLEIPVIPVKKNKEPPCKDPKPTLVNPPKKARASIFLDETDASRKIPCPVSVKRRTSALPQLASTMPSLPGPLQRTSFNQTSKIRSPVPKFVRRSQSFQSDRRVPERVETFVEPRQYQSRIGGIRGGRVPRPSGGLPRPSFGQVPISSSMNSSFSSVSRSKSFPKSSVTSCSRISRPSFYSTRKPHHAGQRTPPPDRSLVDKKNRTSISEARYFCHTDLPSPWPGYMNDRLCRKLFSEDEDSSDKSSDQS